MCYLKKKLNQNGQEIEPVGIAAFERKKDL
jgi:hypothetical protein